MANKGQQRQHSASQIIGTVHTVFEGAPPLEPVDSRILSGSQVRFDFILNFFG